MRHYLSLLLLSFCLWNCSTTDPTVTNDQEQNQADANGDGTTDSGDDSDQVDSMYFPPVGSTVWEQQSPAQLGWNEAALDDLFTFLSDHDTEAFIILKNGRIVVEAYFNGATSNTANPWFSAGKTLTAFTSVLAQDDGYLSLDDSTTLYLNPGWTSMSPEQEISITLHNQLTMTSGGDYRVSNTNCTDPSCLFYLNDPGEFWYYHNAFYTLIQPALDAAIPQGFDAYFDTELKSRIGMDGTWMRFGFPRIYVSTARSMARFGLLCLNEGTWDGEQLLSSNSFESMIQPSQDINPAYGLLWWLNGKDRYRLPASTAEFAGAIIPNAPADLVAGLGANDQKLYVVPSDDLVVIRMGSDAGMGLLGPSGFDNELWGKLSQLMN